MHHYQRICPSKEVPPTPKVANKEEKDDQEHVPVEFNLQHGALTPSPTPSRARALEYIYYGLGI